MRLLQTQVRAKRPKVRSGTIEFTCNSPPSSFPCKSRLILLGVQCSRARDDRMWWFPDSVSLGARAAGCAWGVTSATQTLLVISKKQCKTFKRYIAWGVTSAPQTLLSTLLLAGYITLCHHASLTTQIFELYINKKASYKQEAM